MKRISFSIITALSLSFSSLSGAGIPVVDVGSIEQAILQYNQLIKNYEQMLKDTANFEKQMTEMGIGMNIGDILGDLNSMINNMQNVYDDVNNVPQDILGNVEKITKACSFLQTKSPYFKDKVSSVSNAINNDFNRCTYAIKNKVVVKQSIDELMDKVNQTTSNEEKEQYYTEIKNIQNAQRFLEQKANEEQTNRIIAFYDTYQKADKNNPYSKEKMTEDLKALSKALAKDNNQKQAQALTNSILIKILETLQRQYELNIEYSNALVNFSQNSSANRGFSDLEDDSYELTYKAPTIDDTYQFGDYGDFQIQTDDNGIPIFTIPTSK